MDDDYDDYEERVDDPNMTLPNFFLTCFDESQLQLYRDAIAFYTLERPGNGLEISLETRWNGRDPALLYFPTDDLSRDLSRFWRILEDIRDKP